ncbi:PKD domain-containing protein [Halapricum desulfuricans]|uniref:Pilin/Flagellin, FlaG/FlaF family n=1 Tax=Halapricum desulfuricans TaxID=2841257 RepID=A0A897MYF6_9EURY|nr:PKD domain-containing protein [Halapricum desulfuricans]QSG05494.1 Pilin/Flagellin, FlaG/FlaF family [Halapricum desulfuricans]
MIDGGNSRCLRAQSEVVGVALLVGVFALLALLVGTVVIGNVTDQASNEPLAEINASASAKNLTLTHGGGDGFEETAITVILRQNGDETRYGLESFTENRGSDTARFSAGERWARNHTLEAGLARVLVVHRPSNSVVYDERIVVPTAPNTPPKAQFDYTPADPDPTENITVDATSSSDPDGNITSYRWDFSDGTTASGPSTNHSYSEEGVYTVSLTVTDDRGAATTVSEQVTVDSTPPSIANATLRDGDDDRNVTSGDSVTISANVSDTLTGVDSVTANASSLDAGTVTLTDGDGDGTYTETTTVGPSPTEGEQSVTIEAVDGADNSNTTATDQLTVDTTEPSVTDATLTDDDGDGVVTSRDSVTISAHVLDSISGVDNVTANASAFDAGSLIELTDDNGNGTYTATVAVGNSPTEGNQSVRINVVDNAGNQNNTTTNPLTVDTTAPQIETFDVTDTGRERFGMYWDEQYDIKWSVSDSRHQSTTVYVNRSGIEQETYSTASGSQSYSLPFAFLFGAEDTRYEIKVVAVDEAGNRACRVVTDESDGLGPDESQYSDC